MIKGFAASMCGLAIWALVTQAAMAGDVGVEKAVFTAIGGGKWRVSVTLRHGDTGWDHYADAWRVVDADGNVLGERTLFHPHVDEQPFTRSQSGIVIPETTQVVLVEGHDKVHGWSPDKIRVDLGRSRGDRYTVKR